MMMDTNNTDSLDSFFTFIPIGHSPDSDTDFSNIAARVL